MNKYIKFGFYTFAGLALIFSCSTEKNTGINRSFHYVNARFNGHFNANELLNVSLATYRANLNEDFYSLIPLEAVPNEQEIEAYYTPIDTAISKLKIVIADHSMPSNDKPAKKNAEHNNYIDENWISIGKAYYYRRDYETALKSFKFINKYFSNNPSNYIGELWMAKTNIRIGNYTDAKLSLDKLDKALENESNSSEAKQAKTKQKKSKAAKINSKGSSSKEEEKVAKFPKKIKFELERTKADLALAHKQYAKTIEFLEKALKEAKKSEDKGRVNFVLGQLYENEGNSGMAVEKYRKSRKYKIPYQMSFNAHLKASILEGGPKIKKELNKMLRDAKNSEFKDQVYYALALIELRENNEEKAMSHLTNSAFYSTINMRQKGMAYEKMGDLRYAKRDYIRAQKYYDSCGTVVDDTYPHIKDIRKKAEKLSVLVVAVETAQYEDSVQRIARMDSDEQEKFLKNVIKKHEEEEQARAKRETEKLRELAKNNSAFQQDMGGKGGGYWSNSSSIVEGATEFEKKWGQRANEDHWRRSEKTIVMQNQGGANGEEIPEGTEVASQPEKPKGPTVESLMEGLPKTDEDFDKSNARLVQALYEAGIIYKEQLQEPDLAKTHFFGVLDRKYESEYNLMSAFQLYKMFETSDETQASVQRNYILNNYPNSDYANYLRDPDYFIKKKERDAVAEQEYVAVLQRYNRKVYYPVISKAESVMENEPDNKYRAKYMLLLAMSKGQTTENKEELLPILDRIIAEYPDTEEAARANSMIDIIKNGYSANEPVIFGNKTIYTYEEKVPQIVLIFLGENDNIDLSKSKISDFTREFFPKSKAKITTNLFGSTQTVVLVGEIPTEKEAKEYIKKYKDTKKYLLHLRNAKALIITAKNMKLLFETRELEQYEIFYQEYY
jgi:tetratricopeptide (TPR) repeat protein